MRSPVELRPVHRGWGPILLAAVLVVSACSDDGGKDSSFDKNAYCAAAQEVAVPVEGTPASSGTLDERLGEISTRAAGWRALQAVAPKKLAEDHATISDAEVARVQSLADIGPATVDELNLALSSITRMLDERFPERGKALEAVNAFTQSECGVSVTEG